MRSPTGSAPPGADVRARHEESSARSPPGGDQLGPFCAELSALLGKQMILPMNTGAEAVESGIKVARKWGYEVKGVPADRARIIVAADAFHGRTTTIVGFSTDPDARGGFGPFTPGFDIVPYGDLDAVRAAVT